MTETLNEKKRIKPKKKFAVKRYYFSFPYFFLAGLFIVIPLLVLLVFAFRDAAGSFTLGNFVKFFTDGVYVQLGNSLLVALVTTVLCLVLAYPVALVLANSKFNKSIILVLMFILPMYINSLLRTFALKSVFDMIGLNNTFMRVVIAHVYDFFPFMLLPIYSVLVNMDKSYAEASYDLGGNVLKTWTRVTLPLSVPGIISGILMVFMPTVSMFAIRDIVANDTTWMMFGNVIDGRFSQGADMYGPGAAYSMILLALVMITMIVAGRMNAKRQKEAAGVV